MVFDAVAATARVLAAGADVALAKPDVAAETVPAPVATTAAACSGVATTESASAAGAPIKHAATVNGSAHAAQTVRSPGDPIPIRFPFSVALSRSVCTRIGQQSKPIQC